MLDILEETGLLGSKPNSESCRSVGKLNYLTITLLDISFVVSAVSWYMVAPCLPHWEVLRIVRYLKVHPRRGFLYRANCA